jgi:hypothetical protein
MSETEQLLPCESRLREATGLPVMSDEFCGGGGDRSKRVQAAYDMVCRIAHMLRDDEPDHVAGDGKKVEEIERSFKAAMADSGYSKLATWASTNGPALIAAMKIAASPAPAASRDDSLDWQDIALWMGFSASVIKSGEPWTAQCQDAFDAAKRAYGRIASIPDAPVPANQDGEGEG